MGCGNCFNYKSRGDKFMEDIFESFPLKNFTFEELEDIYEKRLSDMENIKEFKQNLIKQYHLVLKENETLSNFHLVIINFLLSKIEHYFDNPSLFKYFFFFYSFALMKKKFNKSENIDSFKEIFMHLFKYKKHQKEIIKQMQFLFFEYFNFILYEIPSEISKNLDSEKVIHIEYKIILDRNLKKTEKILIEKKINRLINDFLEYKNKMDLDKAMVFTFSNMPLFYDEILEQLGY